MRIICFLFSFNKFIIYKHLQKLTQMRALMKGNAAEFFLKKEKQPEDPETILNQIEAKLIARYIGIDEQQIQKYGGFFQQVSKIKLPKGFTRHLSTDKTKIHYINEMTGDEDTMHPSIDILKMAFYKMLADATSVPTFNIKTSKLLPFVEEKMVKQCIGLSSKRRQAEKTNLQRDQNGKIVMSKLARIKPDLKALISTRSYMLKALVEKIYTRKQLWGKGKKAGVYAAVLAAERGTSKSEEGDEEVQETEDSLQFYEKIYTSSKKFYEERYGDIRFIPDELQKERSFYRSTPQSVLRNLGILNIEKTRMELYWLARLMQCLPLPPGWSLKVGDTFDKFYYQPKKLLFDLHPSYIYVLEQMGSFKQAYIEMDIIHQNYYNNMKEMVFFDYFQRPYNVDLYAFVQKMNNLPMTKKRAIKKSNELGKNDWMALEGIKNSDLISQNSVIIQNILEYWGTLNCKEDNYIPAISPFGEVVWSSTINERTINYCPHASILKVLVEQKSLQMPTINRQKDLIKFQQKNQQWFTQLVFDDLPEEREKFLQHYIRHDPKPLSQPYTIPTNFKQNQFYDTVFITPFNLESGLTLEPSQTPLWLEKVRAKKSSDFYFSLLSKYPGKYDQIKLQFSKYAMEMIRKHEPSRQQDILRVISEIRTVSELKKFIIHINDIDSREERKRLAAVGAVQDQEDSLGSSISQIDMDNQKDEQDQSEDDLIDIEVQKSQSEVEKQQSVESQDDNNVKVPTEQSKRIQQVSEESSEQQRQPEKYPGIIYKKQEEIQKLSEQQLNRKLQLLKKQKILKHKYSQSSIKDTVQRISKQLLQQQKSSQQLIDRKRNALITRYDSEHAPYKTNPSKILHRDRHISTAINAGNVSEEFSGFKSQTSILSNDEINNQIRQIQARNSKRREQENNERKEQKVVDQTKQTIELLPIKRIKPDINEDPRLRHISQLGDLREFSKTFMTSPTKLKSLKNPNQKKDKNQCEQTSSTTKFNPEASLESVIGGKTPSLKKKLSKVEITKEKLVEQQRSDDRSRLEGLPSTNLRKSHSVLSLSNNSISPTKINSKFNRICLGNTASTLISTQPLTKRGDLIILEARKSLISKGRGIQTLLSKKY